MKKDNIYTEKEIDLWCNIFDQDIVIDIWECQMIFEELEFETFLSIYQKKHLKKYGSYLTIKN